ncbi:hypothetical protein EON63_04630, partial [archaeon]
YTSQPSPPSPPPAFYETTKSGDAVAALKNSLRPLAFVKRDGDWRHIEASLLVPGDLVTLANGSAVPADCRINHGTIELDQAALTGMECEHVCMPYTYTHDTHIHMHTYLTCRINIYERIGVSHAYILYIHIHIHTQVPSYIYSYTTHTQASLCL